MVRITWDLIRKKTEHHDGLLDDLEEITLHQLNIEKLDTIGRVCPKLKILYLQNNLIPKIENIKRLKSLIYLNLALNNITSIPNEIASCEKLKKLDLTINFIDVDELESSITALSQLIHLDELYLTGNPCTTWSGYRLYVIHRLPKLEKLDGVDVTRGDRIQAKNAFEANQHELTTLAEAKRKEKGITAAAAAASSSSSSTKDDDDLEEEKESLADKGKKVSAYTPESRLEMHREQEEFERKKAEDKKKSQKGDQPEDLWKEAQDKMNQKVVLTDADELPKQRNLGRWEFTLKEDPDNIVLDIAVQRFLDTSLIDLDVHPTWFQVLIKGKLLLLHFPQEVNVSGCKVQRLQTNGHLIMTCPKVKKVSQTVETNTKKKTTSGSSIELADGDEKEEEDDLPDGLDASGKKSTAFNTHTNVLDLSTKAGSTSTSKSTTTSNTTSNTSSSNAFHRVAGNSLNQVTSDYGRRRDPSNSSSGGAQMREIAVTRSATLEEARLAAQQQRQQQAQSTATTTTRSIEDERRELERLGLDDSGVPDLE